MQIKLAAATEREPMRDEVKRKGEMHTVHGDFALERYLALTATKW
jgi:hypothetical protein